MTSLPRDASPAEILRNTAAPDDAGAQTADRYQWQAMIASADALSMYFGLLGDDGVLVAHGDVALICEHHEDWSLIDGVSSEIVSAKHRESTRGPFSSIRQLLIDGGVHHLYERWVALGRGQTCRLVTTGGLVGESARLARTCVRLRDDSSKRDVDDVEVVSTVAILLAELQNDATISDDDALAFLASLSIQDGLPRRDHLPDMASHRYGLPVAEKLGRPDAAEAVWLVVLGLVSTRMRAVGPSAGGALPTVLGRPHDDVLAKRTVTLADIDVAVRFGIGHASGYVALPRQVKASRMAIKMARGGCNDNSIERADELRLQYRRYARIVRSNPATSDQQRAVTNTVLRVVDEVTRAVRDDGNDWGAVLWAELDRRFQAMEEGTGGHGLSSDLLLGGVAELADRCKAWFTDRFDAQADLQQLMEGGVAS